MVWKPLVSKPSCGEASGHTASACRAVFACGEPKKKRRFGPARFRACACLCTFLAYSSRTRMETRHSFNSCFIHEIEMSKKYQDLPSTFLAIITAKLSLFCIRNSKEKSALFGRTFHASCADKPNSVHDSHNESCGSHLSVSYITVRIKRHSANASH